jgi:hypothetical protein
MTPKKMNSIFDIGCDDGYLFQSIRKVCIRMDGIDPRLKKTIKSKKSIFLRGFFPRDINESIPMGVYDAIFALAVFEHFDEKSLLRSAKVIANTLTDEGLLILTVPHPFVDKILDLLLFFRLIDGQALEEHHGFNPESLVFVMSKTLQLVKHKRFQLGLNNVFVFKKIA